MSLITLAEQKKLPDALIRVGIRRLLRQRLDELSADDLEIADDYKRELLASLYESPIAIETDAANEQHYEVPAEFYRRVLGKRLKYSACYYESDSDDLDRAEEAMLSRYLERAELADGQRILELGCGWGSLTLFMAEHLPRAQITGVSNSKSQRAHIMAEAEKRGLNNVDIITCDVNELEMEEQFDRVVSIEMFEHMRNYGSLFDKIGDWLLPGGKLFVHIFCHRNLMYPFETEGDDNWMGRYFFTGGLMPAADTLLHFQQKMSIEKHWLVSGRHYGQTSEHWLDNCDRHRDEIVALFEQTYGKGQGRLWWQRWRIFFMACAELFAYDNGNEWLVSHYRFVKVGE